MQYLLVRWISDVDDISWLLGTPFLTGMFKLARIIICSSKVIISKSGFLILNYIQHVIQLELLISFQSASCFYNEPHCAFLVCHPIVWTLHMNFSRILPSPSFAGSFPCKKWLSANICQVWVSVGAKGSDLIFKLPIELWFAISSTALSSVRRIYRSLIITWNVHIFESMIHIQVAVTSSWCHSEPRGTYSISIGRDWTL